MNVAKAIDAIPVVQSTTERAALFPVPAIDQRVYNKSTWSVERWNGVQWLVDIARVVTPQLFGAVADGSADDTASFNLAKVAIAIGAFRLYLPAATYKITDEILFQLDRLNVLGDGQQASIIKFAPTATGKAAFHFKKATAVSIAQVSVRGVGFDASGNTIGTKTAIRITDGEEVILDDFAVSNWSSPGTDCIGLQLRGRQTHSISNFVIAADTPVSIEDNPNSTIDIDHYHFWNGYYIADPTRPNIKIASGVNLSNVTFDGYQAWVKGSDGLVWVDTTSPQNSQQLTIKNVRWEQSVNAAGYMVRIEHFHNLNGLLLENCSGGLNTLGVKLRNVLNPTLRQVTCLNTSGNALDVDSTVQPLILDNCFFQTGSTVSVGTLKKVYDSGRGIAGGSIGSFVIYQLPALISAARTDIPLCGSPVTIAQDATAVIGVAANTCGWLFVITSEDVGAVYFLKGPTNGTAEIQDPFGFFTITKDTAASYNIYYDAGSSSYLIQNKRTGSKVVQWLLLGDSI